MVWSTVHNTVCSLPAPDLGNRNEHHTILAELWAMLTDGKIYVHSLYKITQQKYITYHAYYKTSFKPNLIPSLQYSRVGPTLSNNGEWQIQHNMDAKLLSWSEDISNSRHDWQFLKLPQWTARNVNQSGTNSISLTIWRMNDYFLFSCTHSLSPHTHTHQHTYFQWCSPPYRWVNRKPVSTRATGIHCRPQSSIQINIILVGNSMHPTCMHIDTMNHWSCYSSDRFCRNA